MAEQRPTEQSLMVYTGPDIAAWFFRALGLIIIGIALTVSIWFATDIDGDAGWIFLLILVIPMGIGFLILVGAEILNRMGQRR